MECQKQGEVPAGERKNEGGERKNEGEREGEEYREARVATSSGTGKALVKRGRAVKG